MYINKLFDYVIKHKASDLFITCGVPPAVKVNGVVTHIGSQPYTAEQTDKLVRSLMSDAQRSEFDSTGECQFAINPDGIGRFRVSAFRQRGQSGLVARRIETKIPLPSEIGAPAILSELVMSKRGLIIFVGATGTGKSTSLAALIGHRNRNSKGHIISIEDPIEFVHEHDKCIITQREVGIDTDSIEIGLRNTLRQAPDVIYIGEIRTREAMQHAVTFAETGHLCLSTLHANNANQALDRILHFFPAENHPQLWMDLSLNLKAIVAQQLVPGIDGNSRKPCFEILLNTPLVSDLIRKGAISDLKDLMKRSRDQGMQTFDQALYDLYSNGDISYENALAHADSANDLRLMMKMKNIGSIGLVDDAESLLDLEEQ
jgi:twitching motility protein PilU